MGNHIIPAETPEDTSEQIKKTLKTKIWKKKILVFSD